MILLMGIKTLQEKLNKRHSSRSKLAKKVSKVLDKGIMQRTKKDNYIRKGMFHDFITRIGKTKKSGFIKRQSIQTIEQIKKIIGE